MAEEGRPVKLQKLDHTLDTADAKFVEPPASNGEPKAAETPHVKDETVKKPSEHEGANAAQTGSVEPSEGVPKMSKNQLKKLRREQQWEAGREDRKEKRKEKAKAKKERKREEYRQKQANANGESSNNPQDTASQEKVAQQPVQLPVTIIFDCNFDELMLIPEIKSLGTQITRCYSDNRHAPFRTHLAVASFGGRLKERYNTILAQQYKSWQNFRFFEDDFVTVAEKAKVWMKGENGGQIAGALVTNGESASDHQEQGEIVYLSSESDVTLERLKPYSTYIIGGLVDKNRHKGICYKRAREAGIKTARLPIGEFLKMNSRQVLATNHVLEIMLKWLESGDWGDAFMQVMPKRKGGTLRSGTEERQDEEEQTEAGSKPAVDETGSKPATEEVGEEQTEAGAKPAAETVTKQKETEADSGKQNLNSDNGGVKLDVETGEQRLEAHNGDVKLDADTGDKKIAGISEESSGAGPATEEFPEKVIISESPN
jgi:tRNA (guanine9-N1)-methyltransferase